MPLRVPEICRQLRQAGEQITKDLFGKEPDVNALSYMFVAHGVVYFRLASFIASAMNLINPPPPPKGGRLGDILGIYLTSPEVDTGESPLRAS
jgi:hypothetical protein